MGGQGDREASIHLCLPPGQRPSSIFLCRPFGDAPLCGSQSMGGARMGLLSSSEGEEHVIKAGPIHVLNCLGPRDWFRDVHCDPVRFHEIRLGICWQLRKSHSLPFPKACEVGAASAIL